jgi:hypothetical protein
VLGRADESQALHGLLSVDAVVGAGDRSAGNSPVLSQNGSVLAGTPERSASWEIRMVLLTLTVNLRVGSKAKAVEAVVLGKALRRVQAFLNS